MGARAYVGAQLTTGKRCVFWAPRKPTDESHGASYRFVIGPFITARGARYMAQYGGNSNPHLVTVADAERFAAKETRK